MQYSSFRSALLLGALTRFAAADVAVSKNLPAGWTSSGCYTEAQGQRALAGANYNDNAAMTESSCITFCDNKGFVYAGVEYASECYCGNFFKDGSIPAPLADCGMACSGKAGEACGGGNRLNVFWSGKKGTDPPTVNPGVNGWVSQGCYSDQVNGRALPNNVNTAGGGSAMTVALCTTACKNAGYTFAGAEYSGECFCGNAIINGGASVDKGCDMTCNGNSSEYCGGPNRLNIYKFGATGGGSTSSSSSTTTPVNTPDPSPTATLTDVPDVSSTATSTSIRTGATDLPSGWNYKGCWIDGANGRILASQNNVKPAQTVETCVDACVAAGYTVAGIEYSTECYCGNQIIQGGKIASDESDCGMACGGDSTEKCGGPNRMSIYAKGDLKALDPPAVQTKNLPGSWTYAGCMTETVGGARGLKWQIVSKSNNTATSCLTQCSDFGYMSGGMEYGEECYCGDHDSLIAAGSTKVDDTQCGMACSGDAQYLCGAGNRLSYYRWTGDPLYVWHYPTGNNAGEYQFFTPGLVIPLIATPGINGKISFVEKFGTSPAGNSTGAYELDPSLLGPGKDWTKAWREMSGLKTDVFCAAGLILPDKKGRQIDVGGWANDATYGIRFYTPDGSPGVTSKNEWEENYNEIHLQSGRWYPTAMMMANGSILVVGGQDGSNGKPVPSLEILPKVGGTLYCDWLFQTDPYNLYPYLAVLPSGGIFAAYYNQARVLDAGSLGTLKTLPDIPGAVNQKEAGRTYPFEGTSMLMPQVAPYTDPLEILICGGSGPGPEIALDNCVSIKPEEAKPKWVIERMPSQRVMPCMVALPDATFLILNGGQQGVAGFGLGNDPNLNALLYDPSQPAGQRISLMANTTIARLYHSEGVLMDDGRVLVSGSDPEDPVHPQEYRIEVFVPPYLKNGGAAPSISATAANKDWAYGRSYSFSVSSGTVDKVTLLAAVSSTHGNSMGQRTLVPSFSCSGATCTVQAPPNANVSPPGWWQLFALQNGVPSHAVWVRIGGDPARLGTWPNYPDFTLPGV